jgi:branched-chain amino acid transport system permease protein
MTRATWAPRAWAGLAAAVALAFPVAFGGNASIMSIATQCLIYALVAAALNLVMGYCGQVSLGHAGLLAVGAYTAAIVAIRFHLPLPLEILAAGLVSAAVGFILGLPTGRLQGLFLVILTLGFGVVVPQIALNWTSLTNGWAGLSMPPASFLGQSLAASPTALYGYVLLASGLSLAAMASLVRTRSGRIFMAVRDGEAAAMAMGIDVWRAKVTAFTTSAFFCGVAGDLLAHWTGLVAPTSFPFDLSLLFFAMVVVGGMASVWGPVAGAVLLVVVEDLAAGVGGLSTALIGAAVVLTLLLAPEGLASIPRAVSLRLRPPDAQGQAPGGAAGLRPEEPVVGKGSAS